MEELLTPFCDVREVGSIVRKVFPGGGMVVDCRGKDTVDRHLNMAMSVQPITILNEFYAVRKH